MKTESQKRDDKLDILLTLEDNWNSYGASPPNQEAVDKAKKFVGLIPQNVSLRISPSAVGGVGITWRRKRQGDISAYVEFYNCGKAYYLLSDGMSTTEAREVLDNEEVIEEIKTWVQYEND